MKWEIAARFDNGQPSSIKTTDNKWYIAKNYLDGATIYTLYRHHTIIAHSEESDELKDKARQMEFDDKLVELTNP